MEKKPILPRGYKIPLIFAFLSGMTIMGSPKMNSDDQNSRMTAEAIKSFIVADNDKYDRPHNPESSLSGRQNNSADENKRDTDDYEPQCDTPVWAMCTKRKKIHRDD